VVNRLNYTDTYDNSTMYMHNGNSLYKMYIKCEKKKTKKQRTSRCSQKFMTISTWTDALQYSFFPRTVIDWNHLDRNIVSAGARKWGGAIAPLLIMIKGQDVFCPILKFKKRILFI